MAMSALVAAVCDLMGWADGEALRARLARVAPEVATELGVTPEHWNANHRFVREVAERATVNETYFFRHAEQLVATCAEVQHAFPAEKLSCWSAGCSTGEEPYSLAMQFFMSGLPADRLEVLGTDVSASALHHARTAKYPEWSFRGVPRVVREQCFTRVKDSATGVSTFEVAERFRRPVSFASHNLLSPPPVRRAHLISCRNALIYLHPAAVQVVLRHLDSVLLPGGFLMLGSAEQHFAAALGFESVLRGGVVLLRKPSAEVEVRKVEVLKDEVTRPHPEPSASGSLHLGAASASLRCLAQQQRWDGSAPPAGRGETASDPIAAAWTSLRAGDAANARSLAARAAADHHAEAHLILATLDEAAGDVPAALEHLRRALYLDPTFISAHVAQASLFRRLGRERDASRARANALRHLGALAPETLLCGIHPITARALRDALEAS
jgi:chemotaxis methyl-accepting protein methylase